MVDDKEIPNGGDPMTIASPSSPSTTPTNEKKEPTTTDDDQQLISLANDHFKEDRVLVAARLLFQVQEKSLLQTAQLQDILQTAQKCQELIHDLESSVETGGEWTKQGESHGNWNSVIYYKLPTTTTTTHQESSSSSSSSSSRSSSILCRCETPIPPSLLVPLLSVLNESELYSTWLPSWNYPVRIGVTQSEKLHQTGRANQVIAVTADVPWPLSTREVVICATAVDDIAQNGHIAVQLQTLHTGDQHGTLRVPPPQKTTTERMDVEGGFLFRTCPPNHPALPTKSSSSRPPSAQEDLILASLALQIDAKIGLLPSSIINFIVRTVIGRIWGGFLQVAEDVRDGKRPPHAQAIAAKRDSLYNWVEERTGVMLEHTL